VPDYLRRDRGLVDKDEARRTQLGLLGFQRSAFGSNVSSILLGRVQFFFEGNVVTVEKAPDRTDAGLLLYPRTQTHADLFGVRSGSAAINSISHCLCCSKGERLCPVTDLASTFQSFSSDPSIGLSSKRRG
jgi:hypothetical protein